MTWKKRFKLNGKKLKKRRREMKIRKNGKRKEKVFKLENFIDEYE